MHQYICLGRNHGMTLEQGVHIREERSISLKFQKKAFPLSKDLALSYLEKIGSVEAPHKWCTILTHWYAIDTNWPCYSSHKYFYAGVKQYIPVLLVGKRFVETILDLKSFFFSGSFHYYFHQIVMRLNKWELWESTFYIPCALANTIIVVHRVCLLSLTLFWPYCTLENKIPGCQSQLNVSF